MNVQTEPIFPLPVRLWHWLNAAFFVTLAVTGFSLHFAGTGRAPVSFRTAVVAHNIAGGLAALNYVAFFVYLLRSGEWRQYAPRLEGLFGKILLQARYYAVGAFRNEPHPFHASRERRFNPLQQLTYLAAMFAGFPLLAGTGLLLLFPGAAPERVAGLGGIWPVAVLHTLLAYFFLAFLIVHVFLALVMAEPETGLRAMLRPSRPRTILEGPTPPEGNTDEMELETV